MSQRADDLEDDSADNEEVSLYDLMIREMGGEGRGRRRY
jgi:hypothetical protein